MIRKIKGKNARDYAAVGFTMEQEMTIIKVIKDNEPSKVASTSTGAVFTNIPILVLVLTLEVYHFNHMPGFISFLQ